MKAEIVAAGLLMVGMVAGCSNHPAMYPTYKNPTQGNTASIRFTGNADTDIFVSQGQNCKKEQYIGQINGIYLGNNRQDLGLPLGKDIPEGSKTELRLPIGATLSFHLRGSVKSYASTSSCNISFSMLPEADAVYEADFLMSVVSCNAALYRIAPDANGEIFRKSEPSGQRPQCNE